MAVELGGRHVWLVMRKALATMKVMRAEINILLTLIS